MHDALKEAQFSPDRPVTRLLHDSPEMRVVVFGLEAGQGVPPHTVPVRVLMHVLQGKGVFLTGRGRSRRTPARSRSRSRTSRTG